MLGGVGGWWGVPGGWVGGSLGVGFLGWSPTQGGTETRRLQGTERAYEGAYTFGACKRVGWQARSVKNPPTLWSGVLEHSDRGEVSSPLPPSALGALPGRIQNLSPFRPNGPSLDPFGQNGA